MVLSGNIIFVMTDKSLLMVDRQEMNMIKSLDLQANLLIHPQTLLNKIILSDGEYVKIINTNTEK